MIALYFQKSEYEFTIVKEEFDGQNPPVLDRALQGEDLIYMKVSLIVPLFCVCDKSEDPSCLVNYILCHL